MQNPAGESSETRRGSLLDWLDPVFERQILSMLVIRYHGMTRGCEETWEAITRSAKAADMALDEDKARYDI